jgi:hypothetical protein
MLLFTVLTVKKILPNEGLFVATITIAATLTRMHSVLVIPIDSKTTKFSAKIHSMIKKITQSL